LNFYLRSQNEVVLFSRFKFDTLLILSGFELFDVL
jgi:hypothetical protein